MSRRDELVGLFSETGRLLLDSGDVEVCEVGADSSYVLGLYKSAKADFCARIHYNLYNEQLGDLLGEIGFPLEVESGSYLSFLQERNELLMRGVKIDFMPQMLLCPMHLDSVEFSRDWGSSDLAGIVREVLNSSRGNQRNL